MERYLQLHCAVTGLCLDSRGQSILLSSESGDVSKLADGKSPSTELIVKGQGYANGVACDANGRLYMCDMENKAIVSFASGEDLVNLVDHFEDEPLLGPSSIAVSSSGSVFFTDSGSLGATSIEDPRGSVYAISGEDHVLHVLAHNSLAHPSAVALSPDENAIYVAETLKNRILRFVQKPQGVYQCSVFFQFSGGLGPTGIAVDGSGNLYVSRCEANNLPTGGRLTIIDASGIELGSISAPFPELASVVIGPPSNPYVFVSEISTQSIYRIPIESLPL